ncbi:GDYXXLXY domain-containing protein [Aquimarina sp. 2201CG5-10]|uniref:GDYXXLXY domain-containing protein n=1 Tax=Aquimarina callyspongiae TaxID=3098150 RepID=UPI002AB3C6C0|nr:GDYXXLXY domain-containing protein [Aquimarina sp. 2201CG5-10]MDY8136423.1 GDYXXLXY domain-containing protein [Aquimarina sp. 2201CG5-10]
MKTKYLLLLFILVALVQIFVPAQIIWNNNDTITSGKAYRFKTIPIDPTDPFRGKYITLRYDMDSYIISDTTYVKGDEIYVYIQNDDQGFAMIHSISKEPLNNKLDYVIAEVTGNYNNKVKFKLPFNRFYLEETKAPKAEKAYAEANRNNYLENVYGLVYIKNDTAVLEDVIINCVSISEYVNQ